jgi:hypothetical protein
MGSRRRHANALTPDKSATEAMTGAVRQSWPTWPCECAGLETGTSPSS